MRPATGRCPRSVANATVLRSMAENIAPKSRKAGASVTRPAAGRLGQPTGPSRCHGRSRRAGAGAATVSRVCFGFCFGFGLGVGWVRRCAASSSVPTMHSRLAVAIPEAGNSWVASRVTRAGPITKMNSSLTDSRANAVCSRCASPSTSVLHLVRTMVPIEGMDAPASRPVTSSVQNGAPSSAKLMKTTLLRAKTAACTKSTRRWPSRSARVAITGLSTAYPTAPAAATVPASP